MSKKEYQTFGHEYVHCFGTSSKVYPGTRQEGNFISRVLSRQEGLRKATKNLSTVEVSGQLRTLRVSGTSLKCYHLSWITRLNDVGPLRMSACKPALTGHHFLSILRNLRGNVT